MSRASCVGEAAGAQVEHRVVVELPDRRAVRALHVVGEDLELRLGVDLRVVGEQQRAVGLLGVGLLRVRPDDDLAVEHRARACRRGCPCRPRGCRSAAWRDRSSCGCRPGARRRRDRGRSACSRAPSPSSSGDRCRCGRACRRARTSATRSVALRAACTCMLRDVERVDALAAAPCSDRRPRSRRRTTSVTALVKYVCPGGADVASRRSAPGCRRRRRSACADASSSPQRRRGRHEEHVERLLEHDARRGCST